jgi:hypothetical protein
MQRALSRSASTRVAFAVPEEEALAPREYALERRYALRAVKQQLQQALESDGGRGSVRRDAGYAASLTIPAKFTPNPALPFATNPRTGTRKFLLLRYRSAEVQPDAQLTRPSRRVAASAPALGVIPLRRHR